MIEWLRGLFQGPPDEYRIIRSGPNEERAVIEKGLTEPPDPDLFELERDLEPGTYRCQAIRNGKFGEMEWVRVVGDPQEAREIDALRRELREVRNAVASDSGAQPAGSFDDRLKQATFEAVLGGEMSVGEAKQVAELAAAFEDSPGSLSESVENPTDIGEVGGRALLKFLDDPEQARRYISGAGAVIEEATRAGDGAVSQNGADESDEDEGLDLDAVDSGPTTLADLEARGEAASAEDLADELDEADQEDEPDEPDESDADAVAAEMTDEREAAMADGGEPDPAEVADEL